MFLDRLGNISYYMNSYTLGNNYFIKRRSFMRKGSYKKWNDAEIQFIRENANSMKDEELAVNINRITGTNDITVAMVRRQRRKLNIAKTRGRRVNKVIVTSPVTE
jgi:hypothetical protein